MTIFGPRALHTSDRPSLTAQSVTLMRAVEARRPVGSRIVDDPFAAVFLSGVARASLPLLTAARPVLDLAERNRLTGLATYVLCRHAFIDAHLLAALGGGAEQVLILGAGYDSRAYRFAIELADRPVYEVDLPPLSRAKAAIVSAHESVFGPPSVHRVEIDFRRQSLHEVLDAAGFDAGRPTFVAWEGVAPYLSDDAVSATLTDLASVLGPGSVLALDLWDGGGPGQYSALRRLGARSLSFIGEPVTFEVTPVAASGLLGAHGFSVVDLAEADELTARYATDGRVAARSIYVVAASLG